MRFKLHLRPVRDKQKLIFNYQYAIQAWLYGLLYRADSEYANFLHNKGYLVEDSKKSFKHFTFSSLKLGKIVPIKQGDECIELSSDNLELVVSFYIDSAAKNFIVGLFQSQTLSIYNKTYQADFIVERIETLAVPDLSKDGFAIVTKQFETSSPMVMAFDLEKKSSEYISPEDIRFKQIFAINLMDKYRSLQKNGGLLLDASTAQSLIQFRLLTEPAQIKKSGFLVKEGKKREEMKVIGYDKFVFEVTAPSVILNVGYLGGFGRFCAMGCGCTNII